MATIVPVRMDLAEFDTHPKIVWTVRNSAGVIVDLTSGNRSVTLYYRNAAGQTLWKKVLSKSGTPTDGTVTFTPDDTYAYYPDGLSGTQQFTGWCRYIDTDIPQKQWFKRALLVTAEEAPGEP